MLTNYANLLALATLDGEQQIKAHIGDIFCENIGHNLRLYTCLGHLGWWDKTWKRPISVTPPKGARASGHVLLSLALSCQTLPMETQLNHLVCVVPTGYNEYRSVVVCQRYPKHESRVSISDVFKAKKPVTATCDIHYCTCPGNLGWHGTNSYDPTCVVLPKVTKANTIVTVTCCCHWHFHAQTLPMDTSLNWLSLPMLTLLNLQL